MASTTERWGEWNRPPCNTLGFGAQARATRKPDPKRPTSAIPPVGGDYGGRIKP